MYTYINERKQLLRILSGAERLEVNAVGVRAGVHRAGGYALGANAERKEKQIKCGIM